MVGAKLWIPVVHLEAGLSSGDRRMPRDRRNGAEAYRNPLGCAEREGDAREPAQHVAVLGEPQRAEATLVDQSAQPGDVSRRRCTTSSTA